MQAARQGRPSSRSSSGVERMRASFPAYVRNNTGQRGEDIAEAMGAGAKTIRLRMKKLNADGEVRTRGQRRGMRYYVA